MEETWELAALVMSKEGNISAENNEKVVPVWSPDQVRLRYETFSFSLLFCLISMFEIGLKLPLTDMNGGEIPNNLLELFLLTLSCYFLWCFYVKSKEEGFVIKELQTDLLPAFKELKISIDTAKERLSSCFVIKPEHFKAEVQRGIDIISSEKFSPPSSYADDFVPINEASLDAVKINMMQACQNAMDLIIFLDVKDPKSGDLKNRKDQVEERFSSALKQFERYSLELKDYGDHVFRNLGQYSNHQQMLKGLMDSLDAMDSNFSSNFKHAQQILNEDVEPLVGRLEKQISKLNSKHRKLFKLKRFYKNGLAFMGPLIASGVLILLGVVFMFIGPLEADAKTVLSSINGTAAEVIFQASLASENLG